MHTTALKRGGVRKLAEVAKDWHPGSFTKNFSWGPVELGLKALHEFIRVGFNGELQDTLRSEFRSRVVGLPRPDYIPLNFFLFNENRNGSDVVVADELVYQALSFSHTRDFDTLALFAFHLSIAGTWRGSRPYQRRPALWAFHYLADRVGDEFAWDASKINADDIERFVGGSPRYVGDPPRKLATNLNYLYKVGGASRFRNAKPTRWWLSALFLTLDRTISPQQAAATAESQILMTQALARAGFRRISGKGSIAKDISTNYFLTLYGACGGRLRFDDQTMLGLSADYGGGQLRNDPAPITGSVDAFHRTDVTARKSIPRVCEILARYAADFETVEMSDNEAIDIESWVKDETLRALDRLSAAGVKPNLTSDEAIKLMRGE